MATAERTLVLAAVERELEPIRSSFAEAPGTTVAWRTTGVGKAAAAISTARALSEVHPDLALLVGCAGAFPSSGLQAGDVVFGNEEVFGDDGVAAPEGFLDLAALELPAARRGDVSVYNVVPIASPPEDALRVVRERASSRYRVAAGRLVTVSTGSGTDDRAREIEERWKPLAESMEGASVALACWLHSCPLIEIRGVSNPVGDRDRGRWELDRACRHAAEAAIVYLEWRRSHAH